MAKFLAVIVSAEGESPLALFRDVKVGRQWAVDHFPGGCRVEEVEMFSRADLKIMIQAAILELEQGVAAEAIPPASSLSPEACPLPPAPSAGLPQTKADLVEAGEPHTKINWSGDPDLREHDEAVTPKSVKRRSKKLEQ